jgi:hypothetical protein
MSNWREEGKAVIHQNNPEGFDRDAFEKEKAESLDRKANRNFLRREFGDRKAQEYDTMVHQNNPEDFDRDAFEKEKEKSLEDRKQADFFRKEFGDGKSFGHRDVMPYHALKDSKEWKKAKGTDFMGKFKGKLKDVFSRKNKGGKRKSKKHNKKSKKNRKSRKLKKGGNACKEKCKKDNANDVNEYINKNKSKSRAYAIKHCAKGLEECKKKCDKEEERKRSPGVGSIRRTQKRNRGERDYDRNPGSVSPMRGDTPEPPDSKRPVPYGWDTR